jgi:hypothetical protein
VPRTPALREVSTTGRSAILTLLVSPPAGGACGRPNITQSTCHRSLFAETSDKIIEETHVDLPCAVTGPAYHIRPRGGKQMLATCPRRLYDEAGGIGLRSAAPEWLRRAGDTQYDRQARTGARPRSARGAVQVGGPDMDDAMRHRLDVAVERLTTHESDLEQHFQGVQREAVVEFIEALAAGR